MEAQQQFLAALRDGAQVEIWHFAEIWINNKLWNVPSSEQWEFRRFLESCYAPLGKERLDSCKTLTPWQVYLPGKDVEGRTLYTSSYKDTTGFQMNIIKTHPEKERIATGFEYFVLAYGETPKDDYVTIGIKPSLQEAQALKEENPGSFIWDRPVLKCPPPPERWNEKTPIEIPDLAEGESWFYYWDDSQCLAREFHSKPRPSVATFYEKDANVVVFPRNIYHSRQIDGKWRWTAKNDGRVVGAYTLPDARCIQIFQGEESDLPSTIAEFEAKQTQQPYLPTDQSITVKITVQDPFKIGGFSEIFTGTPHECWLKMEAKANWLLSRHMNNNGHPRMWIERLG